MMITVTCTTPQVDQTTTVIDGGHITTGTIDAGVVNVTNINASNISTGTLNASRIAANSIAVGKLTGSISNGNWKIDLNAGTFTIGNISANNITTGTLSGTSIRLGGSNGQWGTLTLYNGSNTKELELNYNGLQMYRSGTHIAKIGNNLYSNETWAAVDLQSNATGFEISNASTGKPIYQFHKDISTGFRAKDSSSRV